MKYNWTESDWDDFEKQYPRAFYFLGRRSLINERNNLFIRNKLNEWETKRFAELNQWYRDMTAMNAI